MKNPLKNSKLQHSLLTIIHSWKEEIQMEKERLEKNRSLEEKMHFSMKKNKTSSCMNHGYI